MWEGDNYWMRLSRRSANRRQFLRGAALGAGGLAAASLVGCGGDDETSGTNGGNGRTTRTDWSLEEFREEFHGRKLRNLPGWQNGPKSGGTFRFGFLAPVSWDITGAAAAVLPSYVLFHNQLIRFRVDDRVENHNFMEMEPDLAETMPEQPDELTYVFKLREGVTFHDTPPVSGRELTSEDVAYSYEVYRESPTQAPGFEDVDSIQTPDNRTIVIKMKQPAAYFLGNLVLPYHWIFAREQHEQNMMAKQPIGSGPFILESQEDRGGYVAVKNPRYFKKDEKGQQLPYVDRVEVRYFGTPADADAAFRTGDLDQRWPWDFKTWQLLIKTNPDAVTQVTTPPPSSQPYIVMNLNNPPFNDVRVRRALSLAIDRDALITDLAQGMAGYGYGMDHTYFGSEWPFGPDELGEWNRYDLQKAKQLLADAGYPNGIPRTLELFTNVTSGQWFDVFVAVNAMWSQIGVKVDHKYSNDQAQWQSLYFGRKYQDMMGINWVGPAWDPDGFTYMALHSKSPKNYYHVNDPELDALLVKQRRELDPEARKEILREIMDHDLDQVYRIWTIETYKINLRYPYVYNIADTLAAWAPVGWGSHGLEHVWLDR